MPGGHRRRRRAGGSDQPFAKKRCARSARRNRRIRCARRDPEKIREPCSFRDRRVGPRRFLHPRHSSDSSDDRQEHSFAADVRYPAMLDARARRQSSEPASCELRGDPDLRGRTRPEHANSAPPKMGTTTMLAQRGELELGVPTPVGSRTSTGSRLFFRISASAPNPPIRRALPGAAFSRERLDRFPPAVARRRCPPRPSR